MERFVSLLPLFGLASYFVVALVVFVLRSRRGPLVDAEVAGRPASRILGRYWRHYLMWTLSPYERALIRLRVSPNMLTVCSLSVAVLAGALLARGAFAAGGWLYLLAGIFDILDGRIARATGRVSPGGAFFDSVVDRYAELAVFTGLAVYYRESWVLAAVLAAAAGSMMVSYVRARGEALGVDVKVGTMQRPERLLYLGVVVAHSSLFELAWPSDGARPLYAPTVVMLIVLGASANVTALRRIRHTLRELGQAAPVDVLPVRVRRRTFAEGVEASARRFLSHFHTAG